MFAFCRIGYIAILRGLRGYSTGNEISYYQVFLCLRQIQIKVNGVTKSWWSHFKEESILWRLVMAVFWLLFIHLINPFLYSDIMTYMIYIILLSSPGNIDRMMESKY